MKYLVALMMAGLMVSTANAAVWINEIRIDQPSTDNDEYFELCGIPGESLDNLYYLVIGDDGGDGSGNPASRSGNIESVTPLTGYSIPSDGFFLAVEDTYTLTPPPSSDPTNGIPDLVLAPNALNFENSDNVTHMLVRDYTGTLDYLIDTDRDGYVDLFPWTAIIDAVSLIEKPNGAGHTPPSASQYDEWDYSEDPSLGSPGVGPDGNYVPGHVYRVADGSPWAIGNFTPAIGPGPEDSPGFSNLLPEPTSLALMAIGAVAALRRRR